MSSELARISVAGNIGAGKTTLAEALASVLDVPYVPEPFAENPFFSDFYKDRKRWALQAQLQFMLHRIQYHMKVHGDPKFERGMVQDRSAFEDRVFAERMLAEGDMDERDMGLYDGFYDLFAARHGEEVPDAIVFLSVSDRTLMKRIRARARDGEDAIGVKYIHSFKTHYTAFLERMSAKTRVFLVDWDAEHAPAGMKAAAEALYGKMCTVSRGSSHGLFVLKEDAEEMMN